MRTLRVAAEGTAHHYRARAAETARLAETASSNDDLAMYLRMTECWVRLAEQAELRQELAFN